VSDSWKLLTAEAAADMAGLSRPAFYAGVRDGRLPQPLYPARRAPRWVEAELRAALEATRALPRDQVAARRAARLARSIPPAA
jgi:predicted DNA-binding transcriptional regulator AlpA